MGRGGGNFKGKGHFSGQSAKKGKGRGAKGSGRSWLSDTGGAPITGTNFSDQSPEKIAGRLSKSLGYAHRTMGVQDPLCNAAYTDTSGTGDHIPQGVLKVVVSEPVSARAAEQGSDRARSTQPLVPCYQGNRGVEADHRSILPQCLRALPELHYGDASVNPRPLQQGQWLTSLDLKYAYFHIGINPADRRFCHNGTT